MNQYEKILKTQLLSISSDFWIIQEVHLSLKTQLVEKLLYLYTYFCVISPKPEAMDGHMMRVFAIQVHPHNNNIFVSGGWDDTVQVSS